MEEYFLSAFLAGKKMRTHKKVVSLEEYISFLENPIHHDLTNKHLNQIISIHGFKKLHRRPKKDLMDALSSMEMLLPFRSTLKENISSSASLTTEEVIRDLATLEWQECLLQSIETLSSTKENESNGDGIHASGSDLRCLKPKGFTERAGIWGAKRKRNAMRAVSTLASAPAPVPFSSWLSL